MKMNLRAKPGFKPARIIQTTKNIPPTISIQPKRAVKVPTIHTKAAVVVRPPPPKITRPGVAKAAQPKPKGISAPRASVVRPVVRKRTLTTTRPSHLRKAHDQLLHKHSDKIRALRGSGQGRILVILACGPSVNQVPVEGLNSHPKIDIMCINKPEPRVWPSKFWIFCDQSQYKRNEDYWGAYHGTIINASSVRASHPNQIMVRTIAGKGFSRDMTKGFHIGRSTTYTSMQFSLYMGYNKIYIFGCDMGEVDGQMHRYGQNPDVSNQNRQQRFDKEAENFLWGTKSLKDYERQKFVFCSTHNKYEFVDFYERLDQQDAINIILAAGDELMTKKDLELAKIIRKDNIED
jgi:hypothetical protein